MPLRIDIDAGYGGEAPWYVRAVFFALVITFVAHWVLIFTLPNWAPQDPDFDHTVAVRMKGGHVYYLTPGLGWVANNGLLLFIALLVALFVFVKVHAPLYRERARKESPSGDDP